MRRISYIKKSPTSCVGLVFQSAWTDWSVSVFLSRSSTTMPASFFLIMWMKLRMVYIPGGSISIRTTSKGMMCTLRLHSVGLLHGSSTPVSVKRMTLLFWRNFSSVVESISKKSFFFMIVLFIFLMNECQLEYIYIYIYIKSFFEKSFAFFFFLFIVKIYKKKSSHKR